MFFVFFSVFPSLGPLPGLTQNFFYFENLDFKARIWVREERKKRKEKKRKEKKRKERKGKNAPTETGPFPQSHAQDLLCYSRAWKPLTPTMQQQANKPTKATDCVPPTLFNVSETHLFSRPCSFQKARGQHRYTWTKFFLHDVNISPNRCTGQGVPHVCKFHDFLNLPG